MVTFLPPRCCDCGTLPGKAHQSWCPDASPGVLHNSSIELELEPERPRQEASGNASTYRAPTISIDSETLDLEALRPFFTKEALRDAVRGHLAELGYRRAISGVVYEKPENRK
jgi:hypothetical protein